MKTKVSLLFALTLTLLMLFVPASTFAATNDNFASASVVSALPFTDFADVSSATIEPGEPQGCFSGIGTVWYAYTPSVSTWLLASNNSPYPSGPLAVYTGSDLFSLSQVACSNFYGPMTFHVNAGTTYYFQMGGYGGTNTFRLDIAYPYVSFNYNPYQPSVFDPVQFSGYVSDPANVGIQSCAWQFGDGKTDANCYATHLYAANGDYTVTFSATTVDGRTASVTQTVSVRTQDVTITRFSAPSSASAGQARQLSVDVQGDRFGANLQVQVELYKSDPSQVYGIYPGFTQIAYATQLVPVRSGNKTTTFGFNYTFSNADAAIGKVTFRVRAIIVGGRDALPADNEAIASPTKVTK